MLTLLSLRNSTSYTHTYKHTLKELIQNTERAKMSTQCVAWYGQNLKEKQISPKKGDGKKN